MSSILKSRSDGRAIYGTFRGSDRLESVIRNQNDNSALIVQESQVANSLRATQSPDLRAKALELAEIRIVFRTNETVQRKESLRDEKSGPEES